MASLLELMADFLNWHFEKMREPAAKDPTVHTVEFPPRNRERQKKMWAKIKRIIHLSDEEKEKDVDIKSVEEAEEEAQFVLDALEPYPIDYPVVIDVEAVSNTSARTKDLTKEERTRYCIAFCEKIREAGYTPMIYGNMKTFMIMLDLAQLEAYDKWVAFYDEPMYYPYAFKIWQYTDEGKVAGIEGNVDLNISFEEADGVQDE